MKVGERLSLPDGKTRVISEEQVNASKMMLTFPDNPVPFVLVKSEDGWRVDATTIIAARKASAGAGEGGAEQ